MRRVCVCVCCTNTELWGQFQGRILPDQRGMPATLEGSSQPSNILEYFHILQKTLAWRPSFRRSLLGLSSVKTNQWTLGVNASLCPAVFLAWSRNGLCMNDLSCVVWWPLPELFDTDPFKRELAGDHDMAAWECWNTPSESLPLLLFYILLKKYLELKNGIWVL